MMQKSQAIRTRLLTVIMASIGLAAAVPAVGAGVNANVGANAQIAAPGNAQAGGNADTHMSPSGSANSNALWQSDAAKGEDRAAERMSAKGAEMKQSADTEPESTGTAAVKGKR